MHVTAILANYEKYSYVICGTIQMTFEIGIPFSSQKLQIYEKQFSTGFFQGV